MNPTRISRADGTWDQLCQQWEQDCLSYNEDFSGFSPATLPVLQQLATGSLLTNAAVYAVKRESGYHAAFQANVCHRLRYDGLVLRVRHITLSPAYDYNMEVTTDNYVATRIHVFVGALLLSDGQMSARHIKFHLRSPAELQYVDLFQQALKDNSAFPLVETRGAWIHLSKASTKRPYQGATT